MTRAIPNEVRVNEDGTVVISVTRRNGTIFEVLVDQAIWPLISDLQIHVNPVRHKRPEMYAKTRIHGKQWLLHRLIIEFLMDQERPEADHINGNTLDNRLSNLRPADRFTQMGNTRRTRNRLRPEQRQAPP